MGEAEPGHGGQRWCVVWGASAHGYERACRMACGMGPSSAWVLGVCKEIKAKGWKKWCLGISEIRMFSNNLLRLGQITVRVSFSGGQFSKVFLVKPKGTKCEWEFPSPWKYFLLFSLNPRTLRSSQSYTPGHSWGWGWGRGWKKVLEQGSQLLRKRVALAGGTWGHWLTAEWFCPSWMGARFEQSAGAWIEGWLVCFLLHGMLIPCRMIGKESGGVFQS